MSYQVQILPRAQRQLAGLPAADYLRVRDAMLAFRDEPRPHGCIKLKGRDGWRVRVGDYRIICEIDDPSRVVTVHQIGHRRDVYR